MQENVATADRAVRSLLGPALVALGYWHPGGNRGRPAGQAALIGACALLLAGCPDDAHHAEVLPRDTLPAPPPAPEMPAASPPGQEAVLVAREGYTATGVVRAVPHGAETVLALSLQHGPANAILPVRLHSGQCADQGPERAALEPVRTDARGTGMMEATVPLPAQQILTGNHFVHVYEAHGDIDRGVACADLPDRPDLHPDIIPET
jgi:hypothetical protein